MSFFIKLDIKPDSWEERLILFVGFLIDQGKQSSTVRSYVSTIRAVLKDDQVDINEDAFLLKALTNACCLQNDKVKTRLPIKKPLLNLLISRIPDLFQSPQPYLVTLYSALLVITYFGLFRVGEVTESPHVVKAKDVKIGTNKDKLKFILHTSKTHG